MGGIPYLREIWGAIANLAGVSTTGPIDPTAIDSIKTRLVNDSGELITAQHPLPTDGDSVYEKDVDTVNSEIGTFTGEVADLYNDYNAEISDVTATNPKTLTAYFKRPISNTSLAIASLTGDFSNVKIKLMDLSGTVRRTVDDSSDGTKHTSKVYNFPPTRYIGYIVEFHTAAAVKISGFSSMKEVHTISRIQGEKPDGTVVEFNATANGNPKMSLEEFDPTFFANPLPVADFYLLVSQGLVPGHSGVNKFGQNADLNSSTYEDVWDGGGTYAYPADGAATITHIVSTSASDTEDIEVQGLDIAGVLVVQTITLTGTTVAALSTALWRVFRMRNVGSADLVGDVTATDSGKAGTWAKIQIGNNQTLMALFTIPLGVTGYLLQGTNNLSGVTRAVAASGRLTMRQYGGVHQLKKTFGINSEGSSFLSIPSPLRNAIPARTDIRVSAIASANGVSINTTYDILLIDD